MTDSSDSSGGTKPDNSTDRVQAPFNRSSGKPLFSWVASIVAGSWKMRPADLERLPAESRELITAALERLPPQGIVDYHCHVFGVGCGCSGCYASPSFMDGSIKKQLIGHCYMSAGGIRNVNRADVEYMERLVDLVRGFGVPYKACLLAFDRNYNDDGTVNEEETQFYVPNDYVWSLYERFPDCVLPTISVHPYRADAVEELERWAVKGVRMIKWLPNSMNINPQDGRCIPFYEACVRLNMVILCHIGEEKAVEIAAMQRWGNPLLLRAALDCGVRVIMAHCGSLGDNEDLDCADSPLPRVSNLTLFLRMMDDPKYEGLLFGDISATTIFTRIACLAPLLARPDLHARLVHGTDYPLPSIAVLVRTRPLVGCGLLTPQQRTALNPIWDVNPLLYDVVLKRTLCSAGSRFPISMFTRSPALGLFRDEEEGVGL